MPVKRRCCRQDNKAASIDQYRRYSSYRLEQDACECKSNRVATEDDEAKDAVDPPLQRVGDERQPVAKLHDIVDRAGQEAQPADDAQDCSRHGRFRRGRARSPKLSFW